MPFLTVKEAAQLVDKSPSSIRRILYPIIHSESHPDRDQVEPSAADALALRVKGESFPWRLSEELLRRAVPVESVAEHGSHAASNRSGSSSAEVELLAMLRRELDIKNQQIALQNGLMKQHAELIGGLSERLREGNVLIAILQQRLSLSDGRDGNSGRVIDPTPVPSEPNVKPEKGSAGSAKGTKTAKNKPGFLARLFR